MESDRHNALEFHACQPIQTKRLIKPGNGGLHGGKGIRDEGKADWKASEFNLGITDEAVRENAKPIKVPTTLPRKGQNLPMWDLE